MEQINDIKYAIDSLKLDDRVEIKVLIKDLILLLDQEAKTVRDILDVFFYAVQRDGEKSYVLEQYFNERVENIEEDLEAFKDIADDIEIKYESV